jgi:hypothetical protein
MNHHSGSQLAPFVDMVDFAASLQAGDEDIQAVSREAHHNERAGPAQVLRGLRTSFKLRRVSGATTSNKIPSQNDNDPSRHLNK